MTRNFLPGNNIEIVVTNTSSYRNYLEMNESNRSSNRTGMKNVSEIVDK